MPRALFLLLTNLALAAIATAQNLVPNPSFEDTISCTVYDPLRSPAAHWYNVNTATPDIWDCDTVRRCGNYVMDPNDQGVQAKGYLYSFHGDRHAGGYNWYGGGGSNTREYLMAELSEQLQPGRQYEVSLYYARPSGHCTGIDRIGVYLGPDSVFYNTPDTIPLVPQVELMLPGGGYLADTVWTKLTDTLTADGTEQWLIFGTFRSDDFVNGAMVSAWTPSDNTYYYIDQVSVELVIGQGVVVETVSTPVLQANAIEITCQGCTGAIGLMVFDASGRCVWVPRFENAEKWTVQVPTWLAGGAYVVSLTTEGPRQVARFVK